MMNSLSLNPFTRPTFWGRHNEIHMISRYLLSTPPQCCALIGETSFGKTRLLRHLASSQDAAFLAEWPGGAPLPFVYLDCISYVGSARLGDLASARFWWDLYSASQTRLQGKLSFTEARASLEQEPLDRAFELKSALEDLIRQQPRPVVFLLDNFEGIARLPLRDSEWLRSLVQYPCAYVVASRHLLYLLYQYHAENWASPSPLWNIFSGPLYLGLMAEDEVQSFLLQASQLANQAGSHWEARDLDFLRHMAGRHPELLRIACARLFELRLRENQSFHANAGELIAHDARSTCRILWRGLADPELWNTPKIGFAREHEATLLTPYQQVLLDLAQEHEVADTTLLYVLEQRGLIERVGNSWHIFAEAMRQ
ncbi:MAG: AAA family ATPase, partial [Ktedonobacteraceae bacterium]